MLSQECDMFPVEGTIARESSGWRPRPISVVLIDGHDAVRAGIEAWCDAADPPIKIVAEIASHQAVFGPGGHTFTNGDVVVFDPQFDDGPPRFDILSRLRQSGCRVIVYSRLSGDEVILTSLDLGAVSYVVKAAGKEHLIAAVQSVRAPVPYVGPQMATALLKARTIGRTNLSVREKEVLVSWLQTESKEVVAKRFGIAPATVRTHLQRIREKYEAVGRRAPTKSALLARAIEDGLLSLDSLDFDRLDETVDNMLSA